MRHTRAGVFFYPGHRSAVFLSDTRAGVFFNPVHRAGVTGKNSNNLAAGKNMSAAITWREDDANTIYTRPGVCLFSNLRNFFKPILTCTETDGRPLIIYQKISYMIA